MNLDLASTIIATNKFWVDHLGNAVEPKAGQRFCMFYVETEIGGDDRVVDGSIVEYIGEGRVVPDNCDDEDKDDYTPGGTFEDFAVLQA